MTTYPEMPTAASDAAIKMLDRRISSIGHFWPKHLLRLTRSAAAGLAQNPPCLTNEESRRVVSLVQMRLAWHGEDPALRDFLTYALEATATPELAAPHSV